MRKILFCLSPFLILGRTNSMADAVAEGPTSEEFRFYLHSMGGEEYPAKLSIESTIGDLMKQLPPWTKVMSGSVLLNEYPHSYPLFRFKNNENECNFSLVFPQIPIPDPVTVQVSTYTKKAIHIDCRRLDPNIRLFALCLQYLYLNESDFMYIQNVIEAYTKLTSETFTVEGHDRIFNHINSQGFFCIYNEGVSCFTANEARVKLIRQIDKNLPLSERQEKVKRILSLPVDAAEIKEICKQVKGISFLFCPPKEHLGQGKGARVSLFFDDSIITFDRMLHPPLRPSGERYLYCAQKGGEFYVLNVNPESDYYFIREESRQINDGDFIVIPNSDGDEDR